MERISSLEQFLGRYNEFRDMRNTDEFDVFRARFELLRGDLDGLIRSARSSADCFNVFRVLRIHTKEVEPHSRLLGDLLNPGGDHGQEFLFLRLFMKQAVKHRLIPPSEYLSINDWNVELERATEWGRLDLVIRCHSLGYILAIENKIEAGEQPNQVDRYFDWLETQAPAYSQRQLIFLSPDGRRPLSDSTGNAIVMSYHTDMIAMFDSALQQIKVPRLSQILRHYMEIIKTC